MILDPPKSPVRCVLTEDEFLQAGYLAIRRNVTRIMRFGCDSHGMPLVRKWFDSVNGACGEMAFAKAFELPWHQGIGLYKNDPQGDVSGYEVKTHTHHTYLLRLRPDEIQKPRWYAHVTGCAPSFLIHGMWWGPWTAGRDEWLSALDPGRPPAYLIPMKLLRPIGGPDPQPPTESEETPLAPAAPQALPARS